MLVLIPEHTLAAGAPWMSLHLRFRCAQVMPQRQSAYLAVEVSLLPSAAFPLASPATVWVLLGYLCFVITLC